MDDLENLLSDLNSTLGGNTTSSSKGSSSFSRPSHSQPSTTRLPVHEKAAARPSFSSEVWLEPYYTCTRLFDQKEYLENISRVGIGVVTPANAIWNRLLLVGRPRSPSQILEVGDIEALRRIVFHISRYNVVSFKRRSRFPEARVGRCCTAYTRRLGLVVERPEPDFNQQGTLKSPVSLLGALLASQIIQGMQALHLQMPTVWHPPEPANRAAILPHNRPQKGMAQLFPELEERICVIDFLHPDLMRARTLNKSFWLCALGLVTHSVKVKCGCPTIGGTEYGTGAAGALLAS
eukprot:1977401-Pyramimonas_sp.AAC.1